METHLNKNGIDFTGELFNYKNFIGYSDTFCECGVAAGDGIQRALDAGFDKVIGIEAAKLWYDKSIERFKNNTKVILYHGKSIDKLLPVLKVVEITRDIVIYLDAHSSGDSSFGYKECISGNPEFQQENIIKQELNIILSNYNKHIICIDDVNGLADGHAEEYMDLILSYNPDYKFQFWDEMLDPKGPRYKDKILTAVI